jgi:GrpB-like predicted nucleotidyltransferase (UPF0157 family)
VPDPPAEVVEYDPSWPQWYASIAATVAAALSDVEHTAEHVGSTAVPGLAAKPIIDVDIVVPVSSVSAAISALEAAGWQHRGDLGIAGREAFTTRPDLPYHHLYVVVAGSKPHRDHVDLRDYLRGNPAAVAEYSAEKARLAPLLRVDRAAYVAGKADLIDDLLSRARARQTASDSSPRV